MFSVLLASLEHCVTTTTKHRLPSTWGFRSALWYCATGWVFLGAMEEPSASMFKDQWLDPWKKALGPFEMSRTTNPITQYHIPEVLNPQVYRRVYLRFLLVLSATTHFHNTDRITAGITSYRWKVPCIIFLHKSVSLPCRFVYIEMFKEERSVS
jgi:hypothetical protein